MSECATPNAAKSVDAQSDRHIVVPSDAALCGVYRCAWWCGKEKRILISMLSQTINVSDNKWTIVVKC